MFKHKKIDNDYTLEKKDLNQTKIYFATRKRRICLKGTIFIIFNFRLSWDKWKLFLSNKCGAYGWRNKFSFDLNLFFSVRLLSLWGTVTKSVLVAGAWSITLQIIWHVTWNWHVKGKMFGVSLCWSGRDFRRCDRSLWVRKRCPSGAIIMLCIYMCVYIVYNILYVYM